MPSTSQHFVAHDPNPCMEKRACFKLATIEFRECLMFRSRWRRVDALIIDKRTYSTSGFAFAFHEIIVEARFDDGVTKRVTVREGGKVLTRHRVKTPEPGGAVPILISPAGDRAVLDWQDPRINLKAVMRANDRARAKGFNLDLG